MNNDLDIFSPLKTDTYEFPSRICMAPMTRCRADIQTLVPSDLHVKYYSERSRGAAFVLTECTSVSKIGNNFPGACGIYSDEQTEGWKKVTEAVHKEGGKIIIQIWHCGRAGHPEIYGEPISSSPIALKGEAHTLKGKLPHVVPREMTKDDIKTVIEEFRKGAENAKKAGFDGIELHGANGYLVDQFLRDCSNKRTDEYGGSVENRCRFLLEVIDVLINVFGKERTGVRFSPLGRYQDMIDSDPRTLYTHAINELNKREIGFLEIMQADPLIYGYPGDEQISNWGEPVWSTFRKVFKGKLYIANGGLDKESANKLISNGDAELVTFGRPYIANPDLPNRLKNNWPIVQAEMKTWYSPGAEGYCDYPDYKA